MPIHTSACHRGLRCPTSVNASTVDVHGNQQYQSLVGPGTFGQAARQFESLPIDVGEDAFSLFMGFASGVSTVAGEAVLGVVELLSDPIGFAEQMLQLGAAILERPGIVAQLPELRR